MKQPLQHIPRPLSAFTQCGDQVANQDPTATTLCTACAEALEAAQAKFGHIHRRSLGDSPARTCVSFRGGLR